jgi:hypothetical protein
MHDPANHPAIILTLNASHIRRQTRLDPGPLRVTQPEKVSAHDPNPSPMRISIVLLKFKN